MTKRRPRRIGKIESEEDILQKSIVEKRTKNIDLSKYNVGFEAVENTKKRDKPNPKHTVSRYYQQYLNRLEKGDLSKFSNRDILYFFSDTAKDNGVLYVIGNAKVDMRNIKLALERGYSKEDVLAMIEFLFTSGQTYLDISRLHPGILLTGWCNRIYQDTQLWLDDKFDPKATFSKSKTDLNNREWQDTNVDNEDSNLGEW